MVLSTGERLWLHWNLGGANLDPVMHVDPGTFVVRGRTLAPKATANNCHGDHRDFSR